MCYSVYQLPGARSKPAQVHISVARYALRLTKKHRDLPIAYKRGQLRLHDYTDASFAANPDSCRSDLFPEACTGLQFSILNLSKMLLTYEKLTHLTGQIPFHDLCLSLQRDPGYL